MRSGRCRHDEFLRSRGSTKRERLRGVSRLWRLVATPTTVHGVRPHWMLRQLAQPARDRACELVRALCHPQLRARRGLVLELPNKRIHGRASPRTPAASSPRPTRAWTRWTGSRQLARPFGGIVTTRWVATALGVPKVLQTRTICTWGLQRRSRRASGLRHGLAQGREMVSSHLVGDLWCDARLELR